MGCRHDEPSNAQIDPGQRAEDGKPLARLGGHHPLAHAVVAVRDRHRVLLVQADEHLRALVRAEEAPNAKRHPAWQPPIRSALVAIHLRQNELEKVWETFCGGPVDVRLWDKVAAMRGKTHPDDAVTVYRRLLPHAVAAGTRGAQYGNAFEIVKAMRDLRSAQGQDALFREELAEVQATWRAKRNFIKLLAALG